MNKNAVEFYEMIDKDFVDVDDDDGFDLPDDLEES